MRHLLLTVAALLLTGCAATGVVSLDITPQGQADLLVEVRLDVIDDVADSIGLIEGAEMSGGFATRAAQAAESVGIDPSQVTAAQEIPEDGVLTLSLTVDDAPVQQVAALLVDPDDGLFEQLAVTVNDDGSVVIDGVLHPTDVLLERAGPTVADAAQVQADAQDRPLDELLVTDVEVRIGAPGDPRTDNAAFRRTDGRYVWTLDDTPRPVALTTGVGSPFPYDILYLALACLGIVLIAIVARYVAQRD